jgi:hypothetical protein
MNDGDCLCCTTPGAAVPAEIRNRPGLSAVAYRIGTFTTFRKVITDELSRVPELTGLSTRVSDDYTITAIELWSAVADVLTFYQERLANEAFLRTTTLRDSLLRLVRLIGYELSPGAAATTRLAFTLESTARALIPVGTRVASVPAQGQKAQTYETLQAIAASGALNRARIFSRPQPVSPTAAGQGEAHVAPDPAAIATCASLAPGERVMLYAPAATEVLSIGQRGVTDDLLTLRWETPIGSSAFAAAFDGSEPATRAYKLGRSFRLFGYDAQPVLVVAARVVPTDATTTYLAQALTDYRLHGDASGASQLSLDARYTDLKPGSILLAVATSGAATSAIPFTVIAVVEKLVERSATSIPTGTLAAVTVTAVSNTVTQLTLAPLAGGTAVNDLIADSGDNVRNIVLHELEGDPLRFWPFAYPAAVTSRDIYLPGRRNGWSSIEIGRGIEKGAYRPGTTLALSDFAPGRELLLTDAAGAAPLAATVAGVSIVGSRVSFEATPTDKDTISIMGLAPDQVTLITALVSRGHSGNPPLPARPRAELSVRIGTSPPMKLALDEVTLGGGGTTAVALALENAIRAALPGSPTFAHARVSRIVDGGGTAFVVAPGVPGDEVRFGPTAGDPRTLGDLGFDEAQARFLDGVVSARIGPLATGAPVNGTLLVTAGEAPPQEIFTSFVFNDAVSIAATMDADFGLVGIVRDDDRVIVLPPLSEHEPRSHIRLFLDADPPPALDGASAVLLGNVAPASHGEAVRREVLGDGDASQIFQRFTLKKPLLTRVPGDVPGGITSTLQVLVNGVLWDEKPTLFGAGPRDQIYVSRMADDGALSIRFGDGESGARPDTGRQNIVAMYRHGTGLVGRVAARQLSNLVDRPTGVKGVINLLPSDGGADPETLAHARETAPGSVRTFGRAVSLRDFEDLTLMAGEVAKSTADWVWSGDRRVIHLTVAAQGGALFSADGLARLLAMLATERDPNHKLVIANYTAVAVRVTAHLTVDPRHLSDVVLAAASAALLEALSFEQRRFAEPVYLSDMYRVLQDVEGVLAVDIDALDLKSSDAGFRAAHGVDDTLPQPQRRLLMLPARPAGGGSLGILPAEIAWIEIPSQDVLLTASGGLLQ